MTKEQALKHKEVIQWWVDNTDKGVWWNGAGEWMLTLSPAFDLNCAYVQNDEYYEFRKALADGKSIQHNMSPGCVPEERKHKYIDVANISEAVPAKYYRIKPDEPKFKVGDWVQDKNSGFVIQAYENMIKKNFKKWEPKNGELCVFWDNNCNEYFVSKYGTKCLDETFGTSHEVARYYADYTEEYWDNVAPLEFIDILEEKDEKC